MRSGHDLTNLPSVAHVTKNVEQESRTIIVRKLEQQNVGQCRVGQCHPLESLRRIKLLERRQEGTQLLEKEGQVFAAQSISQPGAVSPEGGLAACVLQSRPSPCSYQAKQRKIRLITILSILKLVC
jgi:hypothetical protein